MIGLDVILGGVTGLVGNVITSITNYKTLKIKNEHDEKMLPLQTTAMLEKGKMEIDLMKNKIAGEIELADVEAYTKSQEYGNQKTFSEKWIESMFAVQGKMRILAIPFAIMFCSLFAIVDFLRGFMRPGLTMYLTGLTTVITYMAWDILQKHGVAGMSLPEAVSLFDRVISIVIYLTVSCVTWWFADRRTAKFLQNMQKNKSNEGM